MSWVLIAVAPAQVPATLLLTLRLAVEGVSRPFFELLLIPPGQAAATSGNDAPCPPCINHGASIRQQFGVTSGVARRARAGRLATHWPVSLEVVVPPPLPPNTHAPAQQTDGGPALTGKTARWNATPAEAVTT
eukprot:COSAG01_NODE_5508_length_4212_cov_27.624449_5_plen_133_part_00